MKTKRFKTLKGFYNFVGSQITIARLLNGEFYIYPNRYKVTLEGKALEQIADIIAKYLYNDKEKQVRIRKAVMNHQTDRDEYLQCFYLSQSRDGEFFISNSLSGDAFNYCRRKFLQQC